VNQSEYTRVAVDFYNDIASYLSELDNTTMRSLGDLIAFNDVNTAAEGGIPVSLPSLH
jgi:amidase